MNQLILLIFVLAFKFANCFECNIFDKNKPHVFGTKTNYNESFAYFNLKSALPDGLSFVPKTCKLDQFFLFSRHSTRYPISSIIDYFSELYPKLLKSIDEKLSKKEVKTECENRLYNQRLKWVFRYKKEKIGLIGDVGYEITKEIGKRYAEAFGELLYNSFVKIGITNEMRTLETYKAFLKGFKKPFFGQDIQVKKLVNFHKKSPDEKNDKDKDDELIKKYEKSPEITKLKESISNRFNLKEPLNLNDIKNLYQICAFDYNLFKDTFWCNFFNDEELDQIEFLTDVSTYLKFHGEEAKTKLIKSGIFFKELRDFLISEEEKVFLGFSHTDAFKFIISSLKLSQEKIYLTDSFEESFKTSCKREWRGSRIFSFNSNLAFIKYNCPNPVNNHNIARVLALYQEQPIIIGNCSELLCPIDKFLRYLNSLHTSG